MGLGRADSCSVDMTMLTLQSNGRLDDKSQTLSETLPQAEAASYVPL
jgi:hypothetical protein